MLCYTTGSPAPWKCKSCINKFSVRWMVWHATFVCFLPRQIPFNHLLGNKAYTSSAQKPFCTHWHILTLKAPSSSNVGSRPTEKIRRSMVEAISARIPWGWGKMMTIARETSMAIQSRADRWGSRVPEDEGGHIGMRLEPFHLVMLYSAVFFREGKVI